MRFLFEDAGEIPNNPTLPLLVYKHALQLENTHDPARSFEELYASGGWRAAWRWGVYPFPHYHSTAHEVLGVYRGRAKLRLGHSKGVEIVAEPGDVIVIPAGVGHQNLGSSDDFHVVGGYPEGQTADLLRGRPDDRPKADKNIKSVPLPAGDPVQGPSGPLTEAWNIVR